MPDNLWTSSTRGYQSNLRQRQTFRVLRLAVHYGIIVVMDDLLIVLELSVGGLTTITTFAGLTVWCVAGYQRDRRALLWSPIVASVALASVAPIADQSVAGLRVFETLLGLLVIAGQLGWFLVLFAIERQRLHRNNAGTVGLLLLAFAASGALAGACKYTFASLGQATYASPPGLASFYTQRNTARHREAKSEVAVCQEALVVLNEIGTAQLLFDSGKMLAPGTSVDLSQFSYSIDSRRDQIPTASIRFTSNGRTCVVEKIDSASKSAPELAIRYAEKKRLLEYIVERAETNWLPLGAFVLSTFLPLLFPTGATLVASNSIAEWLDVLAQWILLIGLPLISIGMTRPRGLLRSSTVDSVVRLWRSLLDTNNRDD